MDRRVESPEWSERSVKGAEPGEIRRCQEFCQKMRNYTRNRAVRSSNPRSVEGRNASAEKTSTDQPATRGGAASAKEKSSPCPRVGDAEKGDKATVDQKRGLMDWKRGEVASRTTPKCDKGGSEIHDIEVG